MALVLRFLAKVEIGSLSACWEWTGAVHLSGYGCFNVNKKTRKAHRVSYEIFRGPIPEGLNICHRCDNPPCVNPLHLFLGTQRENMQDAARKGRMSGPRKDYISVPKSDETHPRAKLTNGQVRFIRSNQLGVNEIAKLVGVSRWTIRKVRKQLAYTNVN